MIINTEFVDDYCKEMGDCRACPLADDNGECTYKNFKERYDEAGNEVEDYSISVDNYCYFCAREIKAGNRRIIKAYKNDSKTYICPRCYDKLKKYEKANGLEVKNG